MQFEFVMTAGDVAVTVAILTITFFIWTGGLVYVIFSNRGTSK